jgi:hypothetical protein
MSKYVNTGIVTIHGKQYRIDTYYPCGLSQPNYKMFHVWEKGAVLKGESHTFASEDGFINWLERTEAKGAQRPLL